MQSVIIAVLVSTLVGEYTFISPKQLKFSLRMVSTVRWSLALIFPGALRSLEIGKSLVDNRNDKRQDEP